MSVADKVVLTPEQLIEEAEALRNYMREAARDLGYRNESEQVYWCCQTLINVGGSVARLLDQVAILRSASTGAGDD